MVTAHTRRARAGPQNLSELRRDAPKRVVNRQRVDGKIAVIGDPVFLKRIDVQYWIPWPDDCRLVAHVARSKTRTRPVSRSTVVRNADQRDVQFFRTRDVRKPHERRDPGEARMNQRIHRLRFGRGTLLRTTAAGSPHRWRAL